jgi:hypothetical protein
MKSLKQLIREGIFNTEIDEISHGFDVKAQAEAFMKRFYEDDPYRIYDFRNNTIYIKDHLNSGVKTLDVLYTGGKMIIGVAIESAPTYMPMEEYSKQQFYWGNNVSIYIDCIEKGLKLSDLHLSPNGSHIIKLRTISKTTLNSQQINMLLNRFIDKPLKHRDNLILVIGDISFDIEDLDFVMNPRLKTFDVLMCPNPLKLDPKLCATKNLVLGNLNSLDNVSNLQSRDIYKIINTGSDIDLIEFLTDMTSVNPNTKIYLTVKVPEAPKLSDTITFEYKSNKLKYDYHYMVDCTTM